VDPHRPLERHELQQAVKTLGNGWMPSRAAPENRDHLLEACVVTGFRQLVRLIWNSFAGIQASLSSSQTVANDAPNGSVGEHE
jgi:hypothetical protein